MTEHSHEYSNAFVSTAERQMRRWAMGLEVQDRVDREQALAALTEDVHPYVAISREAGAGGAELARSVATQLNWEFLDKELLHSIAETYNLPEAQLEFVDETTSNWFNEIFGRWLDHRTITQTEYVMHLGKILLLAARDSRTVIVGRGAQFVLPRDKGLLVRIVAPLKRRIEHIMHVRQCVFEEARDFVERTDQERSVFIRRYFHHDLADPHLYDLVINLEHISATSATEMIVRQCQQRFPAEPTAA